MSSGAAVFISMPTSRRPIVLLGGGTTMIGDPSGKSDERNLLSKDILERNTKSIKGQLEKYLDFDCYHFLSLSKLNRGKYLAVSN